MTEPSDSIDDLKTVFSEMKPTSETKKAEIEAMREFVGNGTMRMANTGTRRKSGYVFQGPPWFA